MISYNVDTAIQKNRVTNRVLTAVGRRLHYVWDTANIKQLEEGGRGGEVGIGKEKTTILPKIKTHK